MVHWCTFWGTWHSYIKTFELFCHGNSNRKDPLIIRCISHGQTRRRLGTPNIRTQRNLVLMGKGRTKCLNIQVNTEFLKEEGSNCPKQNTENTNDSANAVLDPFAWNTHQPEGAFHTLVSLSKCSLLFLARPRIEMERSLRGRPSLVFSAKVCSFLCCRWKYKMKTEHWAMEHLP